MNSNPTAGREINKHRPGLVLSSTQFNSQTGLLVIAPITNTKRDHLVAIPKNHQVSGYVNYMHLKSVDFISKEREVKYIENANLELLGKVAQRVDHIFKFGSIFDR